MSGPEASRVLLLLSRMDTPMFVNVIGAFMPVTRADTDMRQTVDAGM